MTDETGGEVDGEVVALFPLAEEGDAAQPVLRDEQQFCPHGKTRLDATARRVYCRECGREVDPFTILEKLAGDAGYYIRTREEAKRQANAAANQLAELRRLEGNAKARVRRVEPAEVKAARVALTHAATVLFDATEGHASRERLLDAWQICRRRAAALEPLTRAKTP